MRLEEARVGQIIQTREGARRARVHHKGESGVSVEIETPVTRTVRDRKTGLEKEIKLVRRSLEVWSSGTAVVPAGRGAS
jgi:hypothetical protein